MAFVGAVHETIPVTNWIMGSRHRIRPEINGGSTHAQRNKATQPTQLTFTNQLGGCDSGCRAVEWQLWITLTQRGTRLLSRPAEPVKAKGGPAMAVAPPFARLEGRRRLQISVA